MKLNHSKRKQLARDGHAYLWVLKLYGSDGRQEILFCMYNYCIHAYFDIDFLWISKSISSSIARLFWDSGLLANLKKACLTLAKSSFHNQQAESLRGMQDLSEFRAIPLPHAVSCASIWPMHEMLVRSAIWTDINCQFWKNNCRIVYAVVWITYAMMWVELFLICVRSNSRL